MDVAQRDTPTVILAEDEASMYLQATTQRVWSLHGQTPIIRVDPSRTKTNFYGTLNLLSGQELVLRAETMDSETTAFYLTCLLETYPEESLLLFWDRAPWHHGPAIERVLQTNPRLEILCYPVACPELNPQERVWKAGRRQISHNHAHEQLPQLATDFETYLNKTTFHSTFLEQYGYLSVRAMFV
jgi:transposase